MRWLQGTTSASVIRQRGFDGQGDRTVLQSIFRIYGSHLQCFLSKHLAIHMYYKLAVQ